MEDFTSSASGEVRGSVREARTRRREFLFFIVQSEGIRELVLSPEGKTSPCNMRRPKGLGGPEGEERMRRA
jgi:hypothetical protein